MPNTKTNWLDPLNKFKIHEAVRDNKSTVNLRDGRLYHITYDKDRVFIAIDKSHGFAPRGWFKRVDILSHMWLRDDF